MTILPLVLLGGLLSTIWPGPGVGLLAAVLCGLYIMFLSGWSIAHGAIAATPRARAYIKFGFGRIFSVIVAAILTNIMALAGVIAFPMPQFLNVGLVGGIFGLYEAMFVSMTYRLSFRRAPVWPIYSWPAIVNVLACAIAIAAFVWFEDLGGNKEVLLGATIFDLRVAFLLAALGIIETSRVTVFSHVSRRTTPE